MARIIRAVAQMTMHDALLAIGVAFVLYSIGVSIYRVFFHPLRHIPGPKLAAMTQWVETYYECFKSPGGQFMWEYQKWHDIYGPIVRIGPNEVHIQDVTFYDTLYSNSRRSDKLKHLSHRFNANTSTFSTAEHSVHRVRRAAINPFFSKRKIASHSSYFQRHMDRLCHRVRTEYLDNGSILNLNNMWGAFTADIVVGYTLEKPYDFISSPNFRAAFSDALLDILDPVHFVTQFPWIIKAFKLLLPDSFINRISPSLASVNALIDGMKIQIEYAKENIATKHDEKLSPDEQQQQQQQQDQDQEQKAKEKQPCLFTSLLESDLPPSELETQRLQHEATSIIGAGIETTMYTLSVCSYHVLSNPRILRLLTEELDRAIPFVSLSSSEMMPNLDTLMQLPYLTAVIQESLRFSYGTTQRIPRLCPTPIVYHPTGAVAASTSSSTAPSPSFSREEEEEKSSSSSSSSSSYVIPLGTIISMDNYSSSHSPWCFPEPYEFRPERWLRNPKAPDGRPLAAAYLVTFGRGTRMCVGMQLAYADLYIGVANFFRRFEVELFETGRDAVDCYMDCFAPRAKPGTKGVRVRVLGARGG